MVSSHLTPELRVNKNGVPVIKHVNNQKSSVQAKSLPAPGLGALSLPSYPEREDVIASLKQDCSYFFKENRRTGEITEAKFTETLESYSNDTIKLLKKYMGNGDDKTYYAELTSLMARDFSEHDVREYVMYSHEVTDCEDLDETLSYVKGLRHYKQLSHLTDLTLADKDQEASGRALLRIAFRLHSESWNEDKEHPAAITVPDSDGGSTELPVIKSPSLVSLVMDNPSRASDIAEYIEENGFKTTKVLAEMVAGTHHATREGFL